MLQMDPTTTGTPDHLQQILLPQMVPLDQVWETMAATGGPALPEVVPLYFSPLHVINAS